jgi:AraC-like DNA-binding protein
MKRNVFALISRDIQRSERLPAHLGRALSAICTSPFTIRSQKELAQVAQCDRSTLIRQWSRAMGDSVSLKDMIDWLLLLRAYSLHRGGRSWAFVAERLGVERRALSSIANRLTGQSMNHWFRDQVLAQFADFGPA